MVGFVKDYRKELISDIWLMPPMYHRVWQWIKYSVNHTEGRIPNNDGTFTELKPGQHATSYRNIAKGVGYYEGKKWREPNVKTIKKILDWLAMQNMISVYGNTQGTIITVENWELYQSENCQGNTKRIASPTRRKHSVDTNKNDKECTKNDKENIYNTLPVQLHEHLKEFIEHRKKIKKPMSDHAVRLMLKKLNELSGGDIETSIQILDQSILNGWAGVFPLKEIKSNEDPYAKLIREAMQDEQGRDYRTSKNHQHLLSEADE